MSLTGVAKETLAICEQGSYRAPSGNTVDLRDRVGAAIAGTRLYRPTDFDSLFAALAARPRAAVPPRIEVTGETTAKAARRLFEAEGLRHLVALNFASAKNPGGGFIGGAKAQEEDLARCSALYPCQLRQPAYYQANRAAPSLLYTDHLIYSPEVPFFRDERLDLLEAPFTTAIVTSPAPNAGEARRHGATEAALRETLARRAKQVLAVCAAHEHRTLVLGAWGCGVFRNEPRDVAEAFAAGLADPLLAGAFERVVFAVWDRSPERPNYTPFAARFGAEAVSPR